MNRWIIEEQLVGRLSDDDWAGVRRHVGRLNIRLFRTRGWARSARTRVLFGLMGFLPLASLLVFKQLGVNAGPGFAVMSVGLLTAWANNPSRYLRSIRRLRTTHPNLTLSRSTRYAQIVDLYASRSLGVRLAVFGAALLVILIAPPGALRAFLGISGWNFVTPIFVSILGLCLLVFPVLPFARLWQTATLESLIATRRDRPAKLGQPPSCLACAHPTLTGPLERCAECGYPNILPPGLFPPTPKTSVDPD